MLNLARLGLAAVLASLAVAGAPTAACAGTATLSPAYWDAANQRWRDAPTTPYDAAKIATYDYASITTPVPALSTSGLAVLLLGLMWIGAKGSARSFSGAKPGLANSMAQASGRVERAEFQGIIG